MKDLERITEHLAKHPHDYQSVISLYKARSRLIEKEMQQRSIEKRKLIAECRKRGKHEESTFE